VGSPASLPEELAQPAEPGSSRLAAGSCLDRCERRNTWCLLHMETGCLLQPCELVCS
jgi:hypothetical protein